MPFLINGLVLLLMSIVAVFGADKEAPFKPGPASSYATRQTNEGVTIAAVPYETEEQAKTAFGKLNPNRYGLLPVLVVIQNDTGKTLKLDNLKVEYVAPDRTKVEATPAPEVPYLQGPGQPDYRTGPVPGRGPRVKRSKNPLAGEQIQVRAFAARMILPKDQASGFFYFQTGHRRGSTLYLTGIADAASGRELFYFEIPLDQ